MNITKKKRKNLMNTPLSDNGDSLHCCNIGWLSYAVNNYEVKIDYIYEAKIRNSSYRFLGPVQNELLHSCKL